MTAQMTAQSGATQETPTPALLSELRLVQERPVLSSLEQIRDQRLTKLRQELADAKEVPVALSPTTVVPRKNLPKVSDELTTLEKSALGIELPTLQSQRRLIDSELAVLNRIDERISEVSRSFMNIFKNFPHAEIVDPSVTVAYFLPNGLPRLALLDPFVVHYERPNCIDVLYRNDLGPVISPRPSALCNDAINHSLVTHIMAATGCFLHAEGYTEHAAKQHSLTLEAVALAKQRRQLTELTELPVPATQVRIIPQFSGTIPKEFRDLILKARNSKLFDEVRLLAEVEGWKVQVWCDSKDEHKMFIKADAVHQPQKDPLVLGIKTIDGQPTAFLLGAFNTTALEEYVRKEWCVPAQ